MIVGNSKKFEGSTIYNPSDFNPSTTQQVNINTDFDETLYIRKSGDIITGDLYLEGASRIIFKMGKKIASIFSRS